MLNTRKNESNFVNFAFLFKYAAKIYKAELQK